MITTQKVVDQDFTARLPKAELHAHLSGSVDVDCLRRIWARKQASGQCLELEDPTTVIRPDGKFHDVISFFPVFDKYIYNLCNDLETVKYMTTSVLENFQKDGVVHLELRTTPRDNPTSGLTKEKYVLGVLEAIREFNRSHTVFSPGGHCMETTLILSVDRRMTIDQAESVVDLAIQYLHPERKGAHNRPHDGNDLNLVVGLDLCGNPAKGNVSDLTNAFRRAKANGLGLTVHFAEIPQSSSDEELETILSWEPDRLGHVIHVNPHFTKIIEERRLGLELCLSCNVLAKMTTGGFEGHHFGRWRATDCPIALSTDDVGIFGSSVSNEYLLATSNFGLGRGELLELSRSAARAVFSGRERFLSLIDRFEDH